MEEYFIRVDDNVDCYLFKGKIIFDLVEGKVVCFLNKKLSLSLIGSTITNHKYKLSIELFRKATTEETVKYRLLYG